MSQSLAGGESHFQVFVHLLGLEDELPGVYDDGRYIEKGRVIQPWQLRSKSPAEGRSGWR